MMPISKPVNANIKWRPLCNSLVKVIAIIYRDDRPLFADRVSMDFRFFNICSRAVLI